MKVALMTFHNGYNYGAALQAYALETAINELGADAEYIDYVNKYRRELYDMRYRFLNSLKARNLRGIITAIVGAPLMNRRARNFKYFYKNNVKKTSIQYHSSSEASQLNDCYDKFIVGSDQVWNCVNNGNDQAYLLDFVKESSKKIAYSSSFGMSCIPDELKADYIKNLKQFARIAVREEKGIELVYSLTGKKAHLVLDPVFLIKKEQWEKHLQQRKAEKNYVFAYIDSHFELDDFRWNCKDADQYDIHLLCSGLSAKEIFNPKVKTRLSMSVEQFLSEIDTADYVITDSFHCLAFCIIFHKPFTVFLSGNRGKDERLLNLLELTGLKDNIYSPEKKIDIRKTINYDDIDEKIDEFRRYSIRYLKAALFSEEDVEYTDKYSSSPTKYMCEDDRCTGCGACFLKCPHNAISMKESYDGFLYPYRDAKLCIDCGLCHSVCQVFRGINEVTQQQYYAIKAADEIREKSTSGGAFTLISDYVLEKKGIICAPAFDTKTYTLAHAFAFTAFERDRMRRTYYLQSNLGDVYKTICNYIKEGKIVLFVGTACQVKGLELFLGSRPDNLYCVDIICHGVGSPKVFAEYIKFISERGQVRDIMLRDKNVGWRGYTDSAIINSKQVKKSVWLQTYDNMVSHSVINRMSCSNCQFTNYDRCGDLTIGDYWGVENFHPDIEDALGVSLVLCNTEKGLKLFSTFKCNNIYKLEKCETIQNSLRRPSQASKSRNQAFLILEKNGYKAMASKYGEQNLFGYVKNFIRKLR